MNAPDPAWRWLPQPRPIGPRFSVQLDMLRWIAAFLVCITHVRSIVIIDHQPGTALGWTARGFYFLHGFGHEAVMIFFILSGYLVGGEILRKWRQREFDWGEYALRRVTRLYPVYLAALAVGGLLDQVGLRFFPETGLYTQALDSPMIFYDASTRLGLGTLVGNVLFCQGILVPTFGSNVPLWSLTNEAWYYVIFPLAGGLLCMAMQPRRRWLCLLLAVVAVWFVRGQVLLYFGVWLLGVVPHFLRRPLIRHPLPALAVACACMIAVRLRLVPGLPVFFWHLAIGVAVVLLLNTLEHAPGPPPAGARWHRTLAGFSYSLYLLHWPVAVFLCGLTAHWFGRGLREEPTLASALGYGALLAAIYLISWLVAQFTEARTAAIRDRVRPFFSSRPA